MDTLLKMVDSLEEVGDVDLLVSFFSGGIDLSAGFPVELSAKESVYPVEDGILDVPEKVEIMLSDFLPLIIVCERALRDHELVPILVERTHEEGQKPDNDGEKPPCIRKQLI